MADGGLLAFILAIDAFGAVLLLFLIWNVPLTLCLHARTGDRGSSLSGTVLLGALGLVIEPHQVSLSLLNRRFPLLAGETEEEAAPVKRAVRPGSIPVLLPAALRIMGAIWRRLRIRRVEGRAMVGLADAAATGMFFGWYAAVRPLARLHRIDVEVVPVFDRPVLDGECSVCLDLLRPGSVAGIAIRELLRPAIRRSVFPGGGG